jgi:hypothetical protein
MPSEKHIMNIPSFPRIIKSTKTTCNEGIHMSYMITQCQDLLSKELPITCAQPQKINAQAGSLLFLMIQHGYSVFSPLEFI